MTSSDDDEYSSESSDADVNAPLKRVYIKDIKGRWLHSNSNIGLITVSESDRTAMLNDGTTWELEEKGGTILMDEYKIVPELSTLSELVWIYPTRTGTKKCRWFFEDEGSQEEEKLESGPATKRQRIECSDVSDNGAPSSDSEDEEFKPQEKAKSSESEEDVQPKGVPELMEEFDEWILSTNTPAHEKRFQRQGFLKKEFTGVKLRGGAIKGLLNRMNTYGITHEHINHRNTGTMIILKEACRTKWIQKHPEYENHFKQGVTTTTAAEPAQSTIEDVLSIKERIENLHQSADPLQVLIDAEQLRVDADQLRQTKVGLAVNTIIKNKSLPDTVRDKAREILMEWKNIFRSGRKEDEKN